MNKFSFGAIYNGGLWEKELGVSAQKEDGLKISLNQVKERAPTATGVSKSMIERVMRRDKATEQKPQLPVVQSIVSLTSSLRRQLVK